MLFTSSPKPKSDASEFKGFRDGAFASLGILIKLHLTGTFQFLNPLLTNNGHCDTPKEFLSRLLIGAYTFLYAILVFTDSYTGSDSLVPYGIAMAKGLWPSPASELINLSKYKLRASDFRHALLSMVVFAVTGLLDPNTVECLYSSS
ncbi:protein DMP2-like [Eucalyptus grandis]|uniref:protein DMP2-like n=1 Tax=Eucalyptus grandis TaxID=71139 RepID=UPI00192F04F9|nr:protein DMP2-like [Eucalyptus grandis]